MKKLIVFGLLLATSAIVHAQNDPYADSVISYTPGTGLNTSYENSSAALGAPTTGSDGSTPYSVIYPAYKNTQIVGIGNGGQLTLEFNAPITNDPANHAYGMDFTIFGNEFFINGSPIGGTYDHTGLTVWVSQDNVTYYQLAVPSGYGADDWLPTNNGGDPGLPVDPSLSLSSFNGLTTAQALALYDGSAGGASFSLSWAKDADGDSVDLSSASYIKIEGTSGYGYVDAVSRVESVPEPSGVALMVVGMGILFFYRWRYANPVRLS